MIYILVIVSTFFFANDFGLIDIEKTAIITAIAIDLNGDEYEVSAQITVPESNGVNSENQKATISSKGKTASEAINGLGNVSGWYPKLSFCNLIILGNDLVKTNVIRVIDYFSKSPRVQDSAIVVVAENTAKELFDLSSPLDNISSFAIQKIILKDPGFDRNIAVTTIKDFCSGYYSENASSFTPFIKTEKTPSGGNQSGGSSSGGSSNSSGSSSKSGSENKEVLFDATNTALFLDGKMVGLLSSEETFAYNLIFSDVNGTSFPLYDADGKNYYLTVMRANAKNAVVANEKSLTAEFSVDIYCKIMDQNADKSGSTYINNVKIPAAVKEKAEETISSLILSLTEKEKSTGCDFLKIKRNLYRFNYPYYHSYKDNFLSVFETKISVNVTGQK